MGFSESLATFGENRGASQLASLALCKSSVTLTRRPRSARTLARTHATTNICKMDFVNKPLLTGELDEVPGLGEVGINTLNRSGIFTTYQVIGKYLEVRKGGSNRA